MEVCGNPSKMSDSLFLAKMAGQQTDIAIQRETCQVCLKLWALEAETP